MSADLDKEFLDSDLPLLTHAPGSPNCLLFQGWVEGGLQDEDIVGRCEIDAHTAATHGQQEDCGGRILLECFYCLHSNTLSTGRLWLVGLSGTPLLLYTSRADAHEVLTTGHVIHLEMGMQSIGTASDGNAVRQSSRGAEMVRLAHLRFKC